MLLRVCIQCGAEFVPTARTQCYCPVCTQDLPDAEQAAARDAYALYVERVRYADQHRLAEVVTPPDWIECTKCHTVLPPTLFVSSNRWVCRACIRIRRTSPESTPAEVRQMYRSAAATTEAKQAVKRARQLARATREDRDATAPPAHKWCYRCDRYYPVSNFTHNVTAYDGYRAFCRDCEHRYRRAFPKRTRSPLSAEGRERRRRYMREYCRRDHVRPKVRAWRAAAVHSRRNGVHPLDEEITVEMHDRIRAETGGRCWLCHAPGSDLDHIVPRVPRKGEPQGPNALANFVYMCGVGNVGKGNRPLPQWLPYRIAAIERCPLAEAQALADRLAERATGRPAAEVWTLFTDEDPDFDTLKEITLAIGALYTPPAGWRPDPPVRRGGTRRRLSNTEEAPDAADWRPGMLEHPLPVEAAVGKTCTKCGTYKGLHAYGRGHPGRLDTRCRECVNARVRARYRRNRATKVTAD